MAINKDADNPHGVRPAFQDVEAKTERFLSGPVDLVTFGATPYQWRPDGANGHADPDGPPVKSTVNAGGTSEYGLPKASITVIRGSISR